MCFHRHFSSFSLLLICLVVVVTHTAKVSNADQQCVDKYHEKYRLCECGREYADILTVRHFTRTERHGLHKYTDPHGNIEYYRCRSCKICQHGLKVESSCSETNDAICGTECEDPSEIYDPATKACQSKGFIFGWVEGEPDPEYLVLHHNIPERVSHAFAEAVVTENVRKTADSSAETNALFRPTDKSNGDTTEKAVRSSFPVNSTTILCIVIVSVFATITVIVAIAMLLVYLFRNCAKTGQPDDEEKARKVAEISSSGVVYGETHV